VTVTVKVYDQNDALIQTTAVADSSGHWQTTVGPFGLVTNNAAYSITVFDVSTPDQYARMLPGLKSSWRTLFGQPNLPFIIIQLPNPDPQEANNWALMREAQAKLVASDSNSQLLYNSCQFVKFVSKTFFKNPR
jgi:hypothetical protein